MNGEQIPLREGARCLGTVRFRMRWRGEPFLDEHRTETRFVTDAWLTTSRKKYTISFCPVDLVCGTLYEQRDDPLGGMYYDMHKDWDTIDYNAERERAFNMPRESRRDGDVVESVSIVVRGISIPCKYFTWIANPRGLLKRIELDHEMECDDEDVDEVGEARAAVRAADHAQAISQCLASWRGFGGTGLNRDVRGEIFRKVLE